MTTLTPPTFRDVCDNCETPASGRGSFFPTLRSRSPTVFQSRNERVVSTSQAVSLDRAKKSSTDTQQRNVTTIVVSIVILFVCCHIPAMTSHLFHSLHSTLDGYEHLECYRRYVSNVSNVLVNLNSACNFVIYCLFSQHFRKQFTSLMCKSCQQPRSALSSNDTTNGRNRDTVHTTAL